MDYRLVSCLVNRLKNTVHGLDDLVRGLRLAEQPRRLVVNGQVVSYRLLQGDHREGHAAPQWVRRQAGEEALHPMDPGTVHQREVAVESRMTPQLPTDLRGLMRAVVVEDQMAPQPAGDGLIDLLQEANEVDGAVESWVRVSGAPKFRGRERWVRSNAWLWRFSSTHRTPPSRAGRGTGRLRRAPAPRSAGRGRAGSRATDAASGRRPGRAVQHGLGPEGQPRAPGAPPAPALKLLPLGFAPHDLPCCPTRTRTLLRPRRHITVGR